VVLERWGEPPAQLAQDDDADKSARPHAQTGNTKHVSYSKPSIQTNSTMIIQVQVPIQEIIDAKDQNPMNLNELFDAIKAKNEIMVDFSKGLQACVRGLPPTTPDDWVCTMQLMPSK
jgi:hypothetical protein